MNKLRSRPTLLLARIEALPLSRWHLKARVIIRTATFFDAIDTVAIGLVLPVIAQAWQLTPGEIGWLISGGFLGQLIGGFGQLAGRIGRIGTMMLAIAIVALGGIASTFATGLASMIVMRMCLGLSGADQRLAGRRNAAPRARGDFAVILTTSLCGGSVFARYARRRRKP